MKWLIALSILLAVAGKASAGEPFAKASIEGDGTIVPGQQVQISVEVFVPDFFTSPPQFPLFDIPNALVMLSDERPQNLVQTVDGVQYSSIRRNYAIVPEIAGGFIVPAFDVELGYSSNGNAVKTSVEVPTVAFQVVSAGDAPVFAARSLSLTQSFDRDPSKLQVGDALVRTVTVFAEETQAMVIPPVDFGQVSGLKQYAKPPRLQENVPADGVGRFREVGSSRTETIVYTVDREGDFDMPAVSYPWTDTDGHVRKTATLSSVKVSVAAAARTDERLVPPVANEQSARSVRSSPAMKAVVLVAVVAVLGLLVRRSLPHLRTTYAGWLHRRRYSRRARLRKLRTVILVGKEPAVYAALDDWSRYLGHRSISAWVEKQGSPRLRAQVGILERRLFRAPDMQLDRRVLARSVDAIEKPKRAVAETGLPQLNPSESPVSR